MFDHLTVRVADLAASRAFYEKALAPLDYKVIFDEDGTYLGFGDTRPAFWIAQADVDYPPTAYMHFAFEAKSREIVDAFYLAAIAAGGKDNGAPGVRANYHEGYYGAFVIDPDGNNIEAVFGNT